MESVFNLFAKRRLIFYVFCLLVPNFALGQVTIGSLDEPAKGAMLDLNPKSAANLGGLLLPNVFITNRDSLPVG
ncbi:MAG: hypothetical protein LBR64_11035, partial [Dysgonamonadaceae bacterium]|nr:hypothetical protein [Dysgonamonadaceae bacterium]